MLLGDFLKEGVTRLEPLYPAPEARNILALLFSDRLGTSRYTYITDPGYTINPDCVGRLSDDLERLASGEPIQYVLGHEEFCGRGFRVTPDVLIPRPETEMLCAEAVKLGNDMRRTRLAQEDSTPVRVLDLCTGSGCIAWTIALDLPGSVVYGIDISEKALAIASGQVFPRSLSEVEALLPERSRRPVFLQADILQDPPQFPGGKFDLILANPPYILESQRKDMRPNVLDHEPSLALFVSDEDPLVFYKAIALWAKALLSETGTGIVEINETLGLETSAVFLAAGFQRVEIIRDFSEKNRFVIFS